MAVGENHLFLLLSWMLLPLIAIAQVRPPQWADPPFLQGPPRDEVVIDSTSSPFLIYMEEEIAGDVYIAKLNYYGNGQPSVRALFLIGSQRYLGAVVRRDATIDTEDPNAWYLVITERQDYESGMQGYNFLVDIVEENTDATSTDYQAEVYLAIVNIDDNPPIIHVVNTCEIPELYVGMTNCTYRVTDIDGHISIDVMTFTMEGRRNEDELFSIEEKRFSDSSYEMEITLVTVKELDYDISAMHILTITAFDSLPNNSSQTIVVQVEDVPNMPPRWVSIFAVEQFDEKTAQNFSVRAIDGDTQINKDIKYRLYNTETYPFFEIDENTGLLTVDKIDRDALKQEVFSFEISAYKYDNITWETPFPVVIIVNDVNDNKPVALNNNFNISIEEETFLSLAFAEDIVIEDIDLAENAQYNVELVDVDPPGAKEAFMILPNEGYQRQTFQITIIKAQLLDFEMLEWQIVKLQVKAQEIMNPEHVNYANVTINLINWNDEVPIFKEEFYEAVFNETEGRGFEVATVVAKDRDIGDEVHHSIMGSVSSFLSISKLTGVITVSADNAFDYQRQNEIIVQVRAVDTLGDGPHNTVFAQLTIKLMDVNNKQPQINLPRSTPLVEENVPSGHVISDGITGSDPDSTANITYSINWLNSYASKQGRPTERDEYVGCVDILTVYEDRDDLGKAQGILVAREIREGVTIDFEMFEVLYLAIVLTDHNQEIGDDFSESMMVIMIEDLNDNPPVWVEGTLEEVRIVREMADAGVVIGSVQATDIDGPLYNNVTYWLFTLDENTPDALVSINPITGQLSVNTGRAIDADTPPKHHLHYMINATDCCLYESQCGRDPTCYNTLGKIEINIIDTNNKIPFTRDGEYEPWFEILENATSGTLISYILGHDLDRDEIYHQVAYGINYREHPSLRNFFAIEELTGRLHVELLNDHVLDRDRGITYHDIYIILTDNHLLEGDRTINTNFTEFRVILLDVNDNAPELPPPSELSWDISENTEAGVELEKEIYAEDIDEPDTDNSRVNYVILALTPVDRVLEYPSDLFAMLNPNNVTGHLITTRHLKGFWGTWDIWIEAHDYGIEPMSSNETYQIIINPYNFHEPVFTFPLEGQIIVLGKERSVPNVVLYYANNVRLDNIHATDEDGLSAGIVTFEVFGDEDAKEYFTIENEGFNTGTLVLTKDLTDDLTTFRLTIRATDQGTDPGPKFTDTTVTVRFVPTQGDPVFEENSAQVAFTELETGLHETQKLPVAMDPKNNGCQEESCHTIYYYIIDGDNSDLFKLDEDTNILQPARELNRSEAIQHTIRVVASNSANRPEAIPNLASTLNVVIEVKESDPRPRFTAVEYTGGITITDPIDKEILIVHATHSENEVITYDILWDTMVTDPSLASVASRAFRINPDTGAIMLNFQQQASMTGMLEFNVSATDVSERENTANVKIYLIADDNRIIFKFFNSLTDVEREREFIESTVTHWFELICNVDWILRSNDGDGSALEDTTDVRAHFIENNIAVDANVIEIKRSDITLMRSLREALRIKNLNLEDVNTGASVPDSSSLDQILLFALAILAAIFAVLCVIVVVVYCITIRRLKRRLAGLSETKYDAKEIMDTPGNAMVLGGELKRHALAPPGLVPGTNRHAIEGSNPVWNEAINAPDFDALSDSSGDSDLIGIEDDPQFSYNNPEFAEEMDKANNIEETMNRAINQNVFAPKNRNLF